MGKKDGKHRGELGAVPVRCVARQSIRLLGFPATSFPGPNTTTGDVERKKNWEESHTIPGQDFPKWASFTL